MCSDILIRGGEGTPYKFTGGGTPPKFTKEGGTPHKFKFTWGKGEKTPHKFHVKKNLLGGGHRTGGDTAQNSK